MTRIIQFLTINDLCNIASRVMGSQWTSKTFNVLSVVAAQSQFKKDNGEFPQSVYEAAAHLLQTILNYEFDVPDKKRLAWVITAVFLEINGFTVAHASTQQVSKIVARVAERSVDLHRIAYELRTIAESPENRRMWVGVGA